MVNMWGRADGTSLPPRSRAPHCNVETRRLMAMMLSLNTDSLEKEGFFSKCFWARISILVEIVTTEPNYFAPHIHHSKCRKTKELNTFFKKDTLLKWGVKYCFHNEKDMETPKMIRSGREMTHWFTEISRTLKFLERHNKLLKSHLWREALRWNDGLFLPVLSHTI